MATPMVAGTAALIWSQNPAWSAAQVTSQLYSSTEDIDAYLSSQYIGKMGVGRINAYNAVNTGPQPPNAEFSGSPTSGDYPLTVNFTDLSTGSPTSWSWTFGDGGSSSAQNPSHEYTAAGTYTVSLTATNATGSDNETKVDYITVTEPGAGDQAYALSDIPVSGTVTGSYTQTHASDNSREQIQERESGGKPSNRYTYLEHRWNFTIPSSTTLMFYVEAYRNNNSDGDDFVFAYSTNDVNYTDLVTVNSATEQVYSASIPSSVSGTVYIRVTDTDQTSGNRSEDNIYIDEMYIEYSSAPCTETTPVAEFSGSPASGDAPLTVDFTDLSSNNPSAWDWDFGDGGSSTAQNPSYEFTSPGTYTVTLTASNCAGSDAEVKTDYITVNASSAYMYVSDMQVGRKTAGPNNSGTCTVTISSSLGGPVENATVYVTATGPVGGNYSGITAADGTVYFETGKIKNPSGEWCFEVTNVTHATYPYNSSANAVTYACESGWVSGQGDPLALLTSDATGLSQNHPNPFNAGTNISFTLSEGGNAELTVYNVLGQAIRHLAGGFHSEGTHTVHFDGTDDRGATVASGMYFYRLITSELVTSKKMILLK
jgi:PKD repeat protein